MALNVETAPRPINIPPWILGVAKLEDSRDELPTRDIAKMLVPSNSINEKIRSALIKGPAYLPRSEDLEGVVIEDIDTCLHEACSRISEAFLDVNGGTVLAQFKLKRKVERENTKLVNGKIKLEVVREHYKTMYNPELIERLLAAAGANEYLSKLIVKALVEGNISKLKSEIIRAKRNLAHMDGMGEITFEQIQIREELEKAWINSGEEPDRMVGIISKLDYIHANGRESTDGSY